MNRRNSMLVMNTEGVTQSERSNERGFTLIETVVALVVMMIVGLGAATLFFYAASNNIGANDRELSMAVAQKRMEWLRSMPLNETTSNTAYSYPNGGLQQTSAQGVTETTTSAGRTYMVTTTISNLDTDADNTAASNDIPPTVKIITVQVRPLGSGPGWTQATSVFGSVRITTQRTMNRMGPHRG
ncbi:MAG TPA: prepilin-type N-terminal cleavage/methylation domain-containing protein [Pyrinomonadaceae bacterium]